MTENAVFVEGQTAFARQIGHDAWPLGRCPMMGCNLRRTFQYSLHRTREGVAQAIDSLKQRQVRIGQTGTDEAMFRLRFAG